ncbi:MAG TPA: aminoacetone oxidase family FAD-binding enzyme, partial [Candidatus Bathyarchaeia archaeon]|nr:aminoacetone oxidase family FAD-binding enzyme [Candidatus Bathyarchaeia archaeon]
MQFYDVAIIGGGPSGMMAAISASQNNKKTVLLERNIKLGRKLLLTGKGRCNFTSSKEIPQIVDAFGKRGKFLYGSLTKFSNQNLISFFESRGVKTKIERGQRVFPQSDNSQTILDCLLNELKKNKVKIIYNFRVSKINKKPYNFTLFSDKGGIAQATSIILATGGKSYPKT